VAGDKYGNSRYLTHDITQQLTAGPNVLGIIAGEVMDSSRSIIAVVMVQLNPPAGAPAEAVGTTHYYTTSDDGWMQADSYITATAWSSAIDWTLEEEGWSAPSFVPGPNWTKVATIPTPQAVPKRALQMPLSTVLNQVQPVMVEELTDGGFLYTFPKNFVGTIRVKALPGADAGASVEVLAGEWLSNVAPAPPPAPPSTCAEAAENKAANIGCPAGNKITAITFASFGTPTGTCKTGFKVNKACDALHSMSAVQRACVGKPKCAVMATSAAFGGDPCLGTKKMLAVQVTCGASTPAMFVAGAASSKSGEDAARAAKSTASASVLRTTTATSLPPLPPRPDNGTVPMISGGKQQYENHVLREGNSKDLESVFCWHGDRFW
jgi:hypothetical protein